LTLFFTHADKKAKDFCETLIKFLNTLFYSFFIMNLSSIFEVYEDGKGRYRRIYTKSYAPGFNVYGERTYRKGKDEYREWDPNRSKVAAAIMKGAPNIFIRKEQNILYLGAASGTTASHISDMVSDGFVFALDFAPRVVRDLVFVCEKRKNMAPLLEDAKHPEEYKDKIAKIDLIIQDIAQKDQVKIFMKNMDMFITKGYGLLSVKARSIDVTRPPKRIFTEVFKELEQHYKIVDSRDLGPFEKDHMMFICKK